jgi:uncharacterized protein YbbC (DUF1343 family)/CubicO group peptidase (beta-lactamase class C family)
VRRTLPLLVFFFLCNAGFRQEKLHELDVAVRDAIAEEKLPGAVLLIDHAGEQVVRVYGNRGLVPRREAMTADTLFDVASITKVAATAPSIHILSARGALDLDASIRKVLREFGDDRVTLRHLLTHTSGLHPGIDRRTPWNGYEAGVRLALAERPRNAPGAVFRYSDVNYILLGEVVRRVARKPLDVFAREEVFLPLQMHETSFRPRKRARAAPTENGLRGVVHDPTARQMGGVAGHAGLFSTAADLAKFAGALRDVATGVDRRDLPDGLRAALRAMTTVASPGAVAVRRGAGFDFDSNYSRPRGEWFSAASFGHTGWTGPFLWIDPASRTFYVFLSNRVHPDGRGSVTALQHRVGTLVAESLDGVAHAPEPRRVGYIVSGGDAENGIDVLDGERYATLRGLRVGVLTSRNAIDRFGNPTADLLRSAPDVTVAAFFSPEHGLSGTADEKVGDSEYNGIPLYSLYGERRAPTREQLKGLDALVVDLPDIGTRFYTYISTMGLAMEAAAAAGVKVIVLDRANPIGGEVVEGPLLEGETNFTAWHPLPLRHGMTIGELARMFRDERAMQLDLTIVPVRGWERAQWQDQAGLPWINTSPNMRSLRAAALYPGIGLLESALSVGRGTATPFEIVGAPYIEGARLAAEVDVAGVRLTPVSFTPAASTHAGEACGGVRIEIADRAALRSVDLGIALASALARLYPEQFPVDRIQPLLRHTATLEAIRAGRPLEEIRRLWDLGPFLERRARYVR